jgi:hypothetical protein
MFVSPPSVQAEFEPPLRVGAYRLRVHPASVTAHSASGVCIMGDGA